MNLIKTGVNRHKITHILFSHFHADHYSALITFFFDAVIYAKYGGGHRPGMTLIGPKGTIHLLRSIMRSFPSFDSAPFRVTFREVSSKPFMIGETRIVPKPVIHVPDLSSVGYRIEYRGKAIVYSGDTQYCDALIRLCTYANLAVLDCSFPAIACPPPSARWTVRSGGEGGRGGSTRLSHFYPIADRYDVRGQAGAVWRKIWKEGSPDD